MNSNENQARESDQVLFSIHKIAAETPAPEPAQGSGFETESPAWRRESGADVSITVPGDAAEEAHE